MATYAVINGDMVENVIVADDKEATEQALKVRLIEYTPENPAGVGWIWDGEKFNPPVYVEETADGV